MKNRRYLLVSLIFWVFLPLSLCLAQPVSPQPKTARSVKPLSLSRKDLIERHFESSQPKPLPQLGGAVPGARLLEQHRLRAARWQSRLKAGHASVPSASAANAILPGIQFRPALPGGAVPTAVITGDFNQDGHMDFIAANGLTNDLWIYLGKGDGTFQLPRIIPLSKGLSPVNLAAADLRGDGKLDLVVAEAGTFTIGVLLGNGDGTFGYEQEYVLPDPPQALVVDDFNHDGKLDIAAVMPTAVDPGTNEIPLIALLTGDGKGNFAAPVITYLQNEYSYALTVASGDVNKDGLPDLLITAPDLLGVPLGSAQVYLNNGDGTFKAGAVAVPNSDFNIVSDAKLADVNGDGCLDAVAADVAMIAWVALGDCTGNFSTPNLIPMGDSAFAIQLADVNGDGNLDIVTASAPQQEVNYEYTSGNTLNVALGDGKGNFGVARTYVNAGQSYSLAVSDFNGDGKPDFVTANNDMDSVNVFLNDGTGSFGFPQGLYMGESSTGVAIASYSGPSLVDLNGDGKPDAFMLSEGSNSDFYATSFLNDGTGRFADPLASDSGIPANYVGDYRLGNFRNTGHQDLVAVGANTSFDPGSELILFVPGNGDGTFGKGTLVTATGANGLIATGDFNGDSKLDFVTVTGTGSYTLTPFLGNGDGTFRTGTPVTFSDGSEEVLKVYSSDFNKDGKLDVLVFSSGNGYWTTKSAVWEFDGNGDGTFQTGKELYTDFQPFTLADVNNDGRLDIARYDTFWPDGTTETFEPAKFWTYLGQANGTFVESSSYSPYNQNTVEVQPTDVAPYVQFGDPLLSSLVGDYNADGKLEEVAFQNGNGYGNYAQILMGNGDGTFTPTNDIFSFYLYHYPLYAYDLDGSGYTDMLQVDANTANEMHVLKGGPAPALQIELEQPIVTGNAGCGLVFPDVTSASTTTVALSSSVAGVMLPSSVIIPANATSAQFCFTLAANYDWRQVFDINAQINAQPNSSTATVYGSSSYSLGFSEALSPATVPVLYAGQSSIPVTVSLTANPGYTSTVNLSCVGMNPGDTCTLQANSLNVSPAAVASTTVTLIPGPESAGTTSNFTILASDGNVIQRQTIAVNVAALEIGNLTGTFVTGSPGTIGGQVYVSGIPPYALSCSGLPAGATCSFSGTPVAYPASSDFAWSLAVPSGLASGDYTFQVNVSSGPETASMTVSFTVTTATATPTFTPPGGTYAGAQTVSLQDATTTSVAAIYYTTDGTTPSAATSTYYIQPIVVAKTETINAIAVASGYLTSAVASAAYTITVPQNPGLTLSGTAVTLAPGATTGNTSAITVTPTGGFTGSVTLTAAITSSPAGAQYPPTLSFGSTNPVTISGTTNGAATLSIATTAATTTASADPKRPGLPWRAAGGAVLACILIVGIPARRRRWQALLGMVALLVTFTGGVLACGGGGNAGGGGGGKSISGTTPGVYTITVTGASGSISTTGNVSLTVQ
jgi:FG-GAP-like repeat/Chitobiase/beta-hexosaminidase C-terminal domain